MHQPTRISGQSPSAIVPTTTVQPVATTPAQRPYAHGPFQDPNHRYGQLQQQTVQQCHRMAVNIHSHGPILEELGNQSLRSWYNCREAASRTRQQAFAAVDQATTIDAEIAQLNRSIHSQLQQFDTQLKASSQTLRQEVAVKVEQYRRHMQQQSNGYRDRLQLDAPEQPTWRSWRSTHSAPAQRLFQSTQLRSPLP